MPVKKFQRSDTVDFIEIRSKQADARINFKVLHLACGFIMATFAILLIWSLSFVARQSAIVLTIFNIFFVVTTFALEGSLAIKSSMLLVGNGIFLLLNYALSYLLSWGLGATYGSVNIFLSSLINLVFVVSFWSVSLTVLAKSIKSA